MSKCSRPSKTHARLLLFLISWVVPPALSPSVGIPQKSYTCLAQRHPARLDAVGNPRVSPSEAKLAGIPCPAVPRPRVPPIAAERTGISFEGLALSSRSFADFFSTAGASQILITPPSLRAGWKLQGAAETWKLGPPLPTCVLPVFYPKLPIHRLAPEFLSQSLMGPVHGKGSGLLLR